MQELLCRETRTSVSVLPQPSPEPHGIATMVNQYNLKKFFSFIDEELSKVRLLCCICHHIHTKDQTEKNRAEHMIFL